METWSEFAPSHHVRSKCFMKKPVVTKTLYVVSYPQLVCRLPLPEAVGRNKRDLRSASCE